MVLKVLGRLFLGLWLGLDLEFFMFGVGLGAVFGLGAFLGQFGVGFGVFGALDVVVGEEEEALDKVTHLFFEEGFFVDELEGKGVNFVIPLPQFIILRSLNLQKLPQNPVLKEHPSAQIFEVSGHLGGQVEHELEEFGGKEGLLLEERKG